MSTLTASLPNFRLVASDLTKLRKRRGLLFVVGLLTIGAVLIANGIIEVLHLSDPAHHGPAGGVTMLGHMTWAITALGGVAAAIVGATAGAGDRDAGVYRELVITGRSRLSLFLSRIPAGLAFLLPFVAAGYLLEAVSSVVLRGGHAAPSTYLLTVTCLWALLEVAFYFLLAVGIASATGSRAYTIGILLAWKLALTPILSSIAALGVARELIPGVALQNLTPAALGNAANTGRTIGMSVAAVAAVLVAWAAAALTAGAVSDEVRDA